MKFLRFMWWAYITFATEKIKCFNINTHTYMCTFWDTKNKAVGLNHICKCIKHGERILRSPERINILLRITQLESVRARLRPQANWTECIKLPKFFKQITHNHWAFSLFMYQYCLDQLEMQCQNATASISNIYFAQFCRLGGPIRVPSWLASGESPPSDSEMAGCLLAGASQGRERALVSSSSYKDSNLSWDPPSGFHINLITSQRVHFQISPCWGSGLQHLSLGGTQTFNP